MRPILSSYPVQLTSLTITLFATFTPYPTTNVMASDQGREGPHSLIHRPATERPALSAPTQDTVARPPNDPLPRRTNQMRTPKPSTAPTTVPVKHRRKLSNRTAIASATAPATSSLAFLPSLATGAAIDTAKTTAAPAPVPIAKSSASQLVGAASTGAAMAAPQSSRLSPVANAANPVASAGSGPAPSGGGSRSILNLLRNSTIASLLQAPTPVVVTPESPPPSPTPPSTAPPPGPSTGSITLSWTPNREPDLAGYKVYVGTASGRYDFPGSPFAAGLATSHTFSVLPKPQTYFFALSAYDSAGNESALSAEVSKSLY